MALRWRHLPEHALGDDWDGGDRLCAGLGFEVVSVFHGLVEQFDHGGSAEAEKKSECNGDCEC